MQDKSVYVLESILPCEHHDLENQYDISDKNEIKCYREFIGVYDSVSNAEKDINELVFRKNEEVKLFGGFEYFGFVVSEKYLNNSLDENGNVSYFESCRTYLSDGRLNCISDCDYRCNKIFSGRDEPVKYINKNDFCLYLSGNRLIPVLVAETSPTKELLNKQFKNGYKGDFTDDSGTVVIKDYGHDHPFAPMLFPIWNLKNYELPETLKTGLHTELERYIDEGI